MKSKVHFSSFCIIITEAVIAALLAGIVTTRDSTDKCLALAVITAAVTLAGLFYCPTGVSTDSKSVKVHRLISGCKTFKSLFKNDC